MNDVLNTRTVKPNAEAIKRLRSERGWRVEDLAKKAGCSVKTIKNVESGNNVYMFTLNKIAKAFKVEFTELATGDMPRPIRKRTWEVTLTVSTPIDEFDESSGLIEIMNVLIKRIGGPDMEPIEIRRGSTRISIKASPEEIMRLIEAYRDGKLDDMDIKAITAPITFTGTSLNQHGGYQRYWAKFYPRLQREFMLYRRNQLAEEAKKKEADSKKPK